MSLEVTSHPVGTSTSVVPPQTSVAKGMTKVAGAMQGEVGCPCPQALMRQTQEDSCAGVSMRMKWAKLGGWGGGAGLLFFGDFSMM